MQMTLVTFDFSVTQQAWIETHRSIVTVTKKGRWLQTRGGALSFDAKTLVGCKSNSSGMGRYKLEPIP